MAEGRLPGRRGEGVSGPFYTVGGIWQKDDRTLGISWSDGLQQDFDVVGLRRACPCAVCIDEHSGRRKIKDADIPDAVRPVRIDSVGRYALNIKFSDTHRTGIYTFEYLRSLTSGTGKGC